MKQLTYNTKLTSLPIQLILRNNLISPSMNYKLNLKLILNTKKKELNSNGLFSLTEEITNGRTGFLRSKQNTKRRERPPLSPSILNSKLPSPPINLKSPIRLKSELLSLILNSQLLLKHIKSQLLITSKSEFKKLILNSTYILMNIDSQSQRNTSSWCTKKNNSGSSNTKNGELTLRLNTKRKLTSSLLISINKSRSSLRWKRKNTMNPWPSLLNNGNLLSMKTLLSSSTNLKSRWTWLLRPERRNWPLNLK